MIEDSWAGVDLLAAVARGVIELASTDRSSAFRLPYPPSLQLALDQVVAAGLMQGLPVPVGVPGMLSWCRESALVEWPVTLPSGFLTGDARLIHPAAGEPTRTCAELASLGREDALEQKAEALLAGLAGACGMVERFAVCRDFLISRPVILRFDPVELLQPRVAQTWKLVKELYSPVPDRFLSEGLVYRCTGCLLLAKLTTEDGPWCEGDCPLRDRVLEPSHQPEKTLVLPLALRLLLALPGRTEQAIRSQFAEQAELIPLGLGVHRVTGDDGVPRAFQVHAPEQPVPAALRAAGTAARLAGGSLDIVVPDRLVERPGYRQAFDRAVPADARVRLVSVSQFTAPQPTGRPRRMHA
ncbi:hypothetical protein AB0C81_18930 [Streptomyces roseoverticillatus]|uniref:pPIWI_RE_Y domain-containing protein n=1 Tax=Streptomyces roseoverticillatus TaxID=66429 RepID=UPI0033E4472B